MYLPELSEINTPHCKLLKRSDLKDPLHNILKNEYYEILEAIEQVNPILAEKSMGKMSKALEEI